MWEITQYINFYHSPSGTYCCWHDCVTMVICISIYRVEKVYDQVNMLFVVKECQHISQWTYVVGSWCINVTYMCSVGHACWKCHYVINQTHVFKQVYVSKWCIWNWKRQKEKWHIKYVFRDKESDIMVLSAIGQRKS